MLEAALRWHRPAERLIRLPIHETTPRRSSCRCHFRGRGLRECRTFSVADGDRETAGERSPPADRSRQTIGQTVTVSFSFRQGRRSAVAKASVIPLAGRRRYIARSLAFPETIRVPQTIRVPETITDSASAQT
ncbi:MAG TPA: hypothetical protein VM940_13945 [Chthoniobacterales bacterium]|nr:hypothetical protein [Chthoniobacterales bacterium]